MAHKLDDLFIEKVVPKHIHSSPSITTPNLQVGKSSVTKVLAEYLDMNYVVEDQLGNVGNNWINR